MFKEDKFEYDEREEEQIEDCKNNETFSNMSPQESYVVDQIGKMVEETFKKS